MPRDLGVAYMWQCVAWDRLGALNVGAWLFPTCSASRVMLQNLEKSNATLCNVPYNGVVTAHAVPQYFSCHSQAHRSGAYFLAFISFRVT